MSNTKDSVSVFAWLRQLFGLKNKEGLLPEDALKAELILGLEELKTRHADHPRLLEALNQEVAALTAPSCQGIEVKKVCRDLVARLRTQECSDLYSPEDQELLNDLDKQIHAYATSQWGFVGY